MEDKKNQKTPKGSRRAGRELRVARVDFNPGPDAEDRLRRLFTILVNLAIRDNQRPPRTDSPPDDDGEAED